MAIIKSSKMFEGSELKPRASTYIKTDTRVVNFGKAEQLDGVYLFILGSYKEDSSGNGVWYRPLKIRDNFGMGLVKKKFATGPNCPIEFFANKMQTIAPNMCKSTETVDDNGRKRWVYPAWGRNAWRVLYNAAYFGKFELGVHVLDLPQSGGASVIDEFVRGRQPDGAENPMINDYQAAIPVHIKLDLKANGQPWKIQINSSKTFVLPEQLADTEYLYNLDDVINYPSKSQLIEELKGLVAPEIFRKGLEGYSDDSLVHEIVSPRPPVQNSARPEADEIPMSFENPVAAPAKPVSVAPTILIPKPNKSGPAKPAPVVEEEAEDTAGLPSNPVVTQNSAMKIAADFLKRNQAKA